MKVIKSGDSVYTNGSHLQGYVEVPFSRLVQAFGEPGQGDGYKVAFEWALEFEDGTVATIYDYEQTSLYDKGLPSPKSLRLSEFRDWHIGGFSRRAVELVLESLGERNAA